MYTRVLVWIRLAKRGQVKFKAVCKYESRESCMVFRFTPFKSSRVSSSGMSTCSWQRNSCIKTHVPTWQHDWSWQTDTHTNTLDKSRRRDTMFPHSFCVTSVSLWPFIACHKSISYVISSWGKKQREKFILGQEWFKAQNQSSKTWLTPGWNNWKMEIENETAEKQTNMILVSEW